MSRVFLVQMPHADLAAVCGAIGKPAHARVEIARQLAERALPHLRRVAASERVIGGVDGKPPAGWSFATRCLPYLSSATHANDILDRLAIVAELDGDDALESWFVDEALALGATPAKLSRAKYRAPSADDVAAWCQGLLDRLAAMRSEVLGWSGSPQLRADYAVTTWVYLAWIFGRLQPAFCHGRGRSLGAATLRFPHGTTESALQRSPRARRPSWIARLLGRSDGAPVEDVEPVSIPSLRELMLSTADLVPSLGMGSQRESLPVRGSSGIASGAVPLVHAGQLATVMAASEIADDWRQLVVAAAHAAERASAHLVEADDARDRWPILPGALAVADSPDALAPTL